jgi:antitoxin YefM
MIHRRPRGKAVTMNVDPEVRSLAETAYLLKSPRNAERLLAALERARAGEGETMTLEQVRRELGLEAQD